MAKRTLPGLGLTGFWPLGTDGWHIENDDNLRLISTLVQGRALSRTTALPAFPVDGDIYVVPPGTDEHKIAIRDEGAWVLLSPQAGYRMWISDDAKFAYFDGTSWADEASGGGGVGAYDIGLFIAGAPLASELLFRFAAVREFQFPLDLGGSYGVANTTSSGTVDFSLRKNGVEFGTLTFTSSSSGSFVSTATSFAVGDVLSVVAPAVVDATLTDISINLRGSVI